MKKSFIGMYSILLSIYLELHLENKVKIDTELRDDVNKLISECTTTKIYTDKHSKLNFT